MKKTYDILIYMFHVEGHLMTSIEMKGRDLGEQLDRLLQDPYIKKCIGSPVLPVGFVTMLDALLAMDQTSTKSQIYLWSAAAILLQMGVEMHNRVEPLKRPQSGEVERRQRYVLAGDYYSSLFYRLLAEQQEITYLKHFSRVISSINQDKLSLHLQWQRQQMYTSEMIEKLKCVTSGLLMAVADFFHVPEPFLRKWKEAARMYLFIDYLQRSGEWKRFSSTICTEIAHEWQALRQQLMSLDGQHPKQLASILTQQANFIVQLAGKEG
jgi:heptaprenyl diphosphate synthase